jgi:2-methylcitrate dehydratase PrpD
MMRSISDDVAVFIARTRYEDLPLDVVHETKRCMLDAIGCAIAGIATDKGKIMASLARRFGGPPESAIVGLGGRVSAPNAAMANGELINALDYDDIPHIHPFSIAPALAVAETTGATGQDLILSVAIARELCKRFTLALSNMVNKLTKEAKTPDVFGNSNECILGGTAGVAKLLGLEKDGIGQALGIAAYLCPLPVCRDWESTVPKSMIKYVPVSWVCQGAVTAGFLAKEGYTGNPAVFDGEYGFARFYGAERWEPEIVVDRLGESWRFMEMAYKTYPCCTFIHAELDAFRSIMEKAGLHAEDVEHVDAYSIPFVANPAPYNVDTQVDVQFSVPFTLALAAHKIRIGADWQEHDVMTDPKIRGFMEKVSMHVDPHIVEQKRKDPRTWPARVVVKAKGQTYTEEVLYMRGTNFTERRIDDEELMDKFRHNASRLLTPARIDNAIEAFWELDKTQDLDGLISAVTL